jgi:hypothetical protein
MLYQLSYGPLLGPRVVLRRWCSRAGLAILANHVVKREILSAARECGAGTRWGDVGAAGVGRACGAARSGFGGGVVADYGLGEGAGVVF